MFGPFTPIDKCIGREITIRSGGQEYVGMMAGIYSTYGMPVIVITLINGEGMEQHLPLQNTVISVRHGQ